MFDRKWSAVLFGALACAAPLALASPAMASTHTVSLTAGPVSLPNVPVSACIDSTCVTTPALSSVTVHMSATTSTGLPLVIPTISACPAGEVGAAITLTALANESATVSGTVSGGSVSVPIGPQTVSLSPLSSATVSACT